MSTRQVNNEVYRRMGHAWWDEQEGVFSTIRFFVHPIRFDFFQRVLAGERAAGRNRSTLLDVGCGGGFLAEDFARAGYEVSGVDPAPESIAAAKTHAENAGLDIRYHVAAGEDLPFADGSFDIVTCCDVLEHVDDLSRVLAEISRVLAPAGLFLYDTINRTIRSKLAVIKVMQEWSSTAFAEPNMHVWERFIRPDELSSLLGRHGLEHREMRGISPRRSSLLALLDFRARARGKISFAELGRRLSFHETSDLAVSYMGYAIRTG